jgi:hypothetical protein
VATLRNPQHGRYIFSAYSNSVGATLHKPLKAFLSDAPCAALPITGGLISQVKEHIEFTVNSLAILRVGRASATVLGERRKHHYVSLATSTVDKLNILDVITADAIVSRVTSVYPVVKTPEGGEAVQVREPRYYLAGSHFDNLKLDGKPIQYEREPSFQSENGFSIQTTEVRRSGLFINPPHEISVAQFGSVHLGEVNIYGGKIILTMLRVELGCPSSGSVAVGQSSTNGVDG